MGGADELYIRLGKRLRATIGALGDPTQNALKGWHQDYERGQDVPIRSVPRPPKSLDAQKQVALEHYASQGPCISWTLRALGYPGRATLTAWLREAFPDIKTVSNGTHGPTTYDIYDIATTGYDLYKAVDEAMSAYKGDVFRVHPDISIYDSNGKLTDIYDWKFDTDKWQGGQAEPYDKALKDAGQNRPSVNPNAEIRNATCKCDGPPVIPPSTASVPTG